MRIANQVLAAIDAETGNCLLFFAHVENEERLAAFIS